jgi:hypothetical protein
MGITSKREAQESLTRDLLKYALDPIFDRLKLLEKETDISPEKLEELKQKYRFFTSAVGIIDRDGKVDHNREPNI